MKANNSSEFRCPFHVKGERDGTIVEISLNDDLATRLQLIVAGFKYFYENPNTISIRFNLPASLQEKCKSLEQLKLDILQYQSEIIAGQLEYRLDPFLPHQMKKYSKEDLLPMFEKAQYKFGSAHWLSVVMKECGSPLSGVSDIALWVELCMISCIRAGAIEPKIMVFDDSQNAYITIASDSAWLHAEDFEEIVGVGNTNRNLFGIVTAPYYPKEFPRYSDTIQIVLSRMKDFTDIPSEQRRKIRYAANNIYRDAGVVINDLEEDKQPAGVWIPEYSK